MTRQDMVTALDEEVDRLEHVKNLLEHSKLTIYCVGNAQPRKQRVLSADARERIAQAQKRRWAKHRAQSSGKA